MTFATEFRQFALKGNVVDLAVGVIIGAAFGRIVDSLVKDIVMPVIGRVLGGLDFSNYFFLLRDPPPGYAGPMTYDALTKAGVPLFAYGNFVSIVLNFLILALIIVWMVKRVNRLRASLDGPAAATPENIVLLREIRDELKKR
jgi:large conductance mechanosensitive channel